MIAGADAAERAGLRLYFVGAEKMEKQKTTVRVAGKDYALVSTDSPEHLNRVAAYVDRQMTETMRSGRIPANTAAVLTALNLADDLLRAQDEVNRLRRELALLREK